MLRFNAACALAALSLFVAAPAQAQQNLERLLIGNWACDIVNDAQALRITTTYFPDGRFQSVGSLDQPGDQLDLGMTVEGRWSLQGDQITEAGSGYSITYARFGDADVPPGSDVEQQLHRNLSQTMSTPNVRTIVTADMNTYVARFGNEPTVTCTRR